MVKGLKVGVVMLTALTGSCFASAVQAQLVGSLKIEIQGLQNQQGNVCIKIFDGSQGFPNNNDRAIKRDCVPIAANAPETAETPFSITVPDLPSSTYAVAVYHDSNGNEQLDRGAFGIPTEGYGFSNDAIATNAPPRFEDAVFLLAGISTTIQIQMQYP